MAFNQNKAVISNPNITVISRFRPMNDLEKNNGNQQVADFVSPTSLLFHSTREKNNYTFHFDRIFNPNSQQEEVYEIGVKPIIESVLEGFNGTVLAYGQTSSGKTYTMQGDMEDEKAMGIIPRMVAHAFNHIYDAPQEIEFTVKVSMWEIYQEKIRDLIEIQRNNLNIREDPQKGIYIEDISDHYVGSQEEIFDWLKVGSENRAQSATNMNEHSSRSHSIFIMTIGQSNKKNGVVKTGKWYLVDLAGSEKISKTGATGHTLEEAKIINKSLTTLGMVINSWTDGKSTHIPYRESKLTRVLQESLGGNSKTALIVTCSPSIYNESETLSTLRFGERAKKIKNNPKINKEVTVEELRHVIQSLESQLEKANKRIVQLENYIVQKKLTIPKSDYDSGNKKDRNSNIGDKLPLINDDKLLEEYRSKLEDNTLTLTQQLINTINSLKESDDNNDSKMEAIAKWLDVKKKFEENEKENAKTIEELKNDLNNAKNIQAKLQNDIIEISTKTEESMSLNVKKQLEESNELIKGKCLSFISNIKSNTTAKGLKILNNFEKEILAINKKDNSTDNNQRQSILDNIVADIKEFKDNDTQTDWYEKEVEKIKANCENEKRLLLRTLEEKNQKNFEWISEMSEIEEKFDVYYKKIPSDSKQYHQKIVWLEQNLQELKTKLQLSQAEKLSFEQKNLKFGAIIKSNAALIAKLEKENNDARERNTLKASVINNNVVKVLKGGHLQNNSNLNNFVFRSSKLN